MTSSHADTQADDDWMVQTAVQAAPRLPIGTVDQLRRYLAPSRTAAPTPTQTVPQRKAA